MDEGWTRWVLDRYQFDYTKLHNEDIKPGKLRQRFDAIILPDQRTNSMLEGLDYKTIVEQYRGGLGEAGWDALRQFVADGGTLISLGEASNLLVDKTARRREGSQAQHHARCALRARRDRQPAGGYRPPGRPRRRAGDAWASTSTRPSSS